jgi:hypothetical protein
MVEALAAVKMMLACSSLYPQHLCAGLALSTNTDALSDVGGQLAVFNRPREDAGQSGQLAVIDGFHRTAPFK